MTRFRRLIPRALALLALAVGAYVVTSRALRPKALRATASLRPVVRYEWEVTAVKPPTWQFIPGVNVASSANRSVAW